MSLTAKWRVSGGVVAGAILAACSGQWEAEVSTPEPAPSEEAVELEVPLQVSEGLCTNEIWVGRELIIRDLAVVNDWRARGNGPWSFGHLMAQLAGARDPASFVREWLSTWEVEQGVPLPGGGTEKVSASGRNARDALIQPWPRGADGKLRLDQAPFRLLAIVFRPDLADPALRSAGELRFVYGALDPLGNPMAMTVAFEYLVTAPTLLELVALVRDWHQLKAFPVGSSNHLSLLQVLTDRLTGAGANPAGVNGSALGQVRTNEIAIDTPWDLREYRLTETNGGTLALSSLPGTPRIRLNGSPELAGALASGFTAETIPRWMEAPMAPIPSKRWFWRPLPGVPNDVRHAFAMSTCNGCHSTESGTRFTHLRPRAENEVAGLSAFLASSDAQPLTVQDPVTGTTRTFREQTRRVKAFNRLLCGG